MSKWNESDYLAYWPKAVPFPYSIKRSQRPVPNSNAVNWPQSQFAPLYLSPGSPSFQPYSYTKNDVPLRSVRPNYSTANYLINTPTYQSASGDNVALPSEANMTAERAPVMRMGMRNTGIPIPTGVPVIKNAPPPPSSLTSSFHRHSATGLGDGFAYELAPLQASAPYGDLAGDCGCGCRGAGCAKKNPEPKTLLMYAALAGVFLYVFNRAR